MGWGENGLSPVETKLQEIMWANLNPPFLLVADQWIGIKTLKM
jgi:hypothetical protein